jgi:hypothetical protein
VLRPGGELVGGHRDGGGGAYGLAREEIVRRLICFTLAKSRYDKIGTLMNEKRNDYICTHSNTLYPSARRLPSSWVARRPGGERHS